MQKSEEGLLHQVMKVLIGWDWNYNALTFYPQI